MNGNATSSSLDPRPSSRPARASSGGASTDPTVIPLFPAQRAEPPLEARGPVPDYTGAYRESLRLERLLGRSQALARVFHRMKLAARIDGLQILLTGPSGAGKSLIARTLHDNGTRADGPFVEVNCAAIPRDLFEAEFFGCARNAYTQATERAGRFAAAQGGTLFLDEVGEIPPAQQAKLLRVLDGGCYERLGEDRTRRTDVRVIAATNCDLEAAVANGTFRADLYYRLNRYRIHVPALAERREDIAELALHLVEQQCRTLELPRVSLSPAALHALEQRAWPGNIRELQSVVEQAVIEASGMGVARIEPEHFDPCSSALPTSLAPVSAQPEHSAEPPPDPSYRGLTYAEATHAFQQRLLRATLEQEEWNVARVARRLDLARSHLYTLLEGFSLSRPRAS